jgi:glutamate dehydrogenase
MLPTTERAALLKKIIQVLHKKTPQASQELLSKFIHRYYANVSYTELMTREVANLAGAALNHWNFINGRAPLQTKVRVYNPTQKEQGWTSKYTVVEISHDDMPFLVDSSRLEIMRSGFGIHLAIHTGCIKLKRNAKHHITALFDKDESVTQFETEAPIHFEINLIREAADRQKLCTNIERVLGDVKHVVDDWQAMTLRLEEAVVDLERQPPKLDPNEIAESKAFLNWLLANHFTLLSCRDYTLVDNKGEKALKLIPHSGLGVHRNKTTSQSYHAISELPIKFKEFMLSSEILIMAKTNTRSTVHRDAYTDYIGIKRFDAEGKMIGERRFIGLYTSSAYHESARNIPLLRHKITQVITNSGLLPNSHAGKALLDILESLPRDDLFQGTVEELSLLSVGILNIQSIDKVKLFVRKDIFDRYLSCLVYVPRNRYDVKLQHEIEAILKERFSGDEITSSTTVNDEPLARIHYVIHLAKWTLVQDINLLEIEDKLTQMTRSWCDKFTNILFQRYTDTEAHYYLDFYRNAFGNSYRENYSPEVALIDIKYIETICVSKSLELSLYLDEKVPNSLHLKIFTLENALSLSVAIPILESMGLSVIDEHPYKITRLDGVTVWVHDFDTVLSKFDAQDLNRTKTIFKIALKEIASGRSENDNFNRLILLADLNWREVVLLRALAKYARQIMFKFSQTYIENTFCRYPALSKHLVDLFKLRFDPHLTNRLEKTALLERQFSNSLEYVSSLDEDKIFRFYLALIHAMLRTNFFQTDASGKEKSYISFKFAPETIPELPLPKPKFEIFVYSPEFEAVHLRTAKVARGGIRWSDRPEDFRTEVLGLMKAQQVKNSIIVPAGAKGGFYPKKLPQTTDRTVLMNAAIECYKNFIRGMLDITDNILNKKIVHPPSVLRYDDEDPYLVVAADKGTATFSDIANKITEEYQFWLGDAFASGGSNGYDHKKMGITARGAWESVKRHFNQRAINIAETDFTVVGIGDMSGDVFGNGMLLSKHIQLVAAFNHQHIFIDPNPDAEISWIERNRLFNLPRSSWSDYNLALLSKGGGIFERTAKTIPINAAIAARLGITEGALEPNELIRSILKAPVDLLWNGGIGTYVKATQETDHQVGDKTNDPLRINGAELRCKIVGEGGNLGFTQLARIEYALQGGAIYTDFIDNAGGVNCSDHEVNLKILLSAEMHHGKLTLTKRNNLLSQLTAEISELVLKDNYEQTQAINLGFIRAKLLPDVYQRYINDLSEAGAINRALENLPDDSTLIARQERGLSLTSPELAILFSYSKNLLKHAILQSDIPDDPYFFKYINLAFPTRINTQFADSLPHHYLRREIIATQLSSSLVNEMGCVFVYRLQEETGSSVEEVVRAYTATRDILDLPSIWQAIEKLDGKIDVKEQLAMMLRVTQVVRRLTRWLLSHYQFKLDLPKIVKKFAPDVQTLCIKLPSLVRGEVKLQLSSILAKYRAANIPLGLATKIATLGKAFIAFDIIYQAQHNKLDILKVADCYFRVEQEVDLIWFRNQINLQNPNHQWDILALIAIRDQLDQLQGQFAINILQYPANYTQVAEYLAAWKIRYKKTLDRWHSVVSKLKATPHVSIVMLFVSLKELAGLVPITQKQEVKMVKKKK